MRVLLVLAIVGVGLGAALLSPFAGLLLYLWFAFFRPQEWVWGAITELRLSQLIALALFARSAFAAVFPVPRQLLPALFVVFVIACLPGQYRAISLGADWSWFLMTVTNVCVGLLIVNLTTDAKRLRAVVAVIGLSIGFYATKFGLSFLIAGGTRYSYGVGGMWSDNNDLALAIVRVIPFMLIVAQTSSNRLVRGALYAGVPVWILAVVGTFSRGGFLALAAATLTYVLLQRRRGRYLAAICLTAGLVGVVALPVAGDYLDRLRTIRTYDEVEEESAISRLHFWRVALVMAERVPLGVGLRQFEANFDEYDFLDGRYGHQRAVHSTHLQALTEAGWVGFGVFGLIQVLTLVVGIRIRHRARDARVGTNEQALLTALANGLLASEVGFLVGGSFTSQLLNDLNWFTPAIMSAADRLSMQWVATSPSRESRNTADIRV